MTARKETSRKTTARATLRAVVNDIAPRIASLPIVSTVARVHRPALQHQFDTQATAIIHHLRRAHGARIALGGIRQRISVAGIDVETVMGTGNLLRLWLATARARLDN